MTVYELTFLLNDEEEVKKIRELAQTLQAKIIEETKWEKKPLVYPIKKNTSADFYIWKLEVDESKVNELKKKLDFNEKIIRYLLLKIATKK
jgi:ribosomal protein S6